MNPPVATHDYQPGALDAALEFLKRTRSELRSLRKARLWQDRLEVIDINGDRFDLRGIGYGNADIVPLLRMVNAAFDPAHIHDPIADGYKELGLGRRHPWAEDRVM